MGAQALEIGVRVHIEGEEYTLLQRINDLWQFRHPKTGTLRNLEYSTLLRMRADRRLTIIGSGPMQRRDPALSSISEECHESAKVKLAYVRAVIDLPNSSGHLEPVIDKVWKRIGKPQDRPSYISVYRWKRKFLDAGQDYRALIDNHGGKGNREPRHVREVVAICQKAIDNVYLQRTGNSIQRTLEHAEYAVLEANKSRLPEERLKMPTRRVIRRMIANLSEFDKYAARHGNEAARHRFRNMKGHIFTSAPLERAEIDHTTLDLIVVDDRTNAVCGRPTVTVCVDDYTRMILGFYIGFKGPSYYAVAQCLKQCIRPKADLRDRYPNIDHDWPSFGVMRNLVCDNGLEFHGTSLEKGCLSLNINITHAPRRTPWAKGKVERVIGSLNRAVAHIAPGTTFSNTQEKGDYDSTKHATVTLSALRAAITKWVVDVYHQQEHRMLETTPAAMWTSSIRPEDIRHDTEDIDLDVALARSTAKRLTHKGVTIDGLLYNSDELRDLRKLKGANVDVEVRVDDDDLGAIWVLSPEYRTPFKVPALNIDYAAGLTADQHGVYRARRKESPNANPGVDGLREAQREVERILKEGLAQRNVKAGKRYARHIETARSEKATPLMNTDAPVRRNQKVPQVLGIGSRDGEAATTGAPTSTAEIIPLVSVTPRRHFIPIVKQGKSNE
jgi:putative transposase